MELNLGTKGATRARREMLDPINLVLRIMKNHPQADVDRICSLVRDALDGPDAKYQRCFNDYCTRNHFNRLVETSGHDRKESKRKESKRDETKKEEEKILTEIKRQVLLLNLEMPNGKRMRYCTGAEMERFGDAYRRIASKVGKTKMVGSVLSENEVRSLL